MELELSQYMEKPLKIYYQKSHQLIVQIMIMSLLLFVSFTTSAANSCKAIFNKQDTTAQKAVETKSWLQDANPQKIKGYVIPGGIIIDDTPGFNRNGFEAADFFVTEEFFRVSGKAVPENAQPIELTTYAYYDAMKDYGLAGTYNAARLNRGGGRDHAIPLKKGTKNFDSSVTEKGSGTNQQYSSVNGNFDVRNFRQNGLQEETEVTSEIVVVRQLEAMGVPIIKHPQARIAPLSFQQLIGAVDENGTVTGKLAAQTTRQQSTPRDSFVKVENVTDQEKYNLVASILINNIGHGGINPENMAQGMLNDPGHVTVGYPIMSGIYRCVLCLGLAGSRDDGTMVGIMDYYFPNKVIKSYDDYFNRYDDVLHATRFKFDTSIGNGIFNSINKQLFGIDEQMTLTTDELSAFERTLRQDIQFVSNRALNLFHTVAAKLLKREKKTIGIFVTSDMSPSVRFLMQLGVLKGLYEDTIYASYVDALIQQVESKLYNSGKKDFHQMVDLFAKVYKKSSSSSKFIAQRKLFSEYLPLNMIIEDINKAKEENKNFHTLSQKLTEVAQKDSQPIRWQPLGWMKVVSDAFTEHFPQ